MPGASSLFNLAAHSVYLPEKKDKKETATGGVDE